MRRNTLLLTFLASAFSLNPVSAEQEVENKSAILGLWSSELIVPPPARGDLTIDATKSEWRATISGISAPIQRDKDAIRFVLPKDAGEFRGLLGASKTIIGHWIQPANEINNNRYATPVKLMQVSDKIWRGKVEPLEARLSLFMSIQRAPEGSITAVIRNPEFNFFRRNIYRVEVNGDRLSFSDTKNSNDKFEARLNKANELTALLPNIDKELVFRRQNPAGTVGFRPIAGPDYNYRRPVATNNGWPTASLSNVDIDSKSILELIEKILHVDPLDNPLNIQSLLIARHGKLVLEEYFYGFDKDRPHDMRSASKTFAPLLVGIAREHGAKIDIDTPVYSQFPEYKEFANPDARKSKMIMRDLMTMTSGLACDDNDQSSPGEENKMQQQKEQPDWYRYTLDLPMARDPGGDQAVYCSAGPLVRRNCAKRDTQMAAGIFLRERGEAVADQNLSLEPDAERRRICGRRFVFAAARPT